MCKLFCCKTLVFVVVPVLLISSVWAGSGSTTSLGKPIYEVVNGQEEVSGEPQNGFKDSYASWKAACANWKKDFKEMNRNSQIFTINCGSPVNEAQQHGLQIHKSMGTFSMKILKEGTETNPSVKSESISEVPPETVKSQTEKAETPAPTENKLENKAEAKVETKPEASKTESSPPTGNDPKPEVKPDTPPSSAAPVSTPAPEKSMPK